MTSDEYQRCSIKPLHFGWLEFEQLSPLWVFAVIIFQAPWDFSPCKYKTADLRGSSWIYLEYIFCTDLSYLVVCSTNSKSLSFPEFHLFFSPQFSRTALCLGFPSLLHSPESQISGAYCKAYHICFSLSITFLHCLRSNA